MTYTMKDLGYTRTPTDAMYQVEMPDGSLWQVPVQVIADSRDENYVEDQEDTIGYIRTGTGMWTDWNSMCGRYPDDDPDDEPYHEKCRRCSGRGTVNLDFHECNVANRYTFHQPHDSTTPFASHEIYHLRPWPTEWQPNQPARKLPCEQVGELLDLLKARYWKSQPKYVHDIYTYMDVGSIEVAAGLM